jgi:hypothetical protein
MGSELQLGVMRAQKREIQMSSKKKLLSVWNWNSFLQLFSKLILKRVISFMNRKSSCGYATHFFNNGNLSFGENFNFKKLFFTFSTQ